jgi:SNF2 family DNA or RNA helicase
LRDFEPRPYQPLMWQHILRYPRCALFVPMGMGKTSAVLMAIVILLLSGSVRKVLILAPLRVARSTWPDEVAKWADFAHLRVSAIVGTPEERLAALRKPADIYTINYDNLVWLIETLGDRWFFDMVVPDEATRLKSFRSKQGGKRAQALSKQAFGRVKRWVNLTGTPAPNGLQDLWGQMWFIDKGHRLGLTFTAFMDRWFGFKRIRDALNLEGKAYVQRIVFPHAQKEIEGQIKDVCLTLDLKDWFDLQDPVVNTLYVDLPPKARKHYEEMEKELFTLLENNEIEAFGAAAKTIKCLQLANGAAYIEGSNEKWIEVHDEKLEALESIIEEAAGAPVLVAYHFRSDLVRIQKRFPQARVLDAKPQTICDWNEGRIQLLLAHAASAGHGLNLADGGNILVFFARWWDSEQHQQIIERIGPVRQFQAGHNRPVFIHHIVARGTVDEDVMERLATKREVQDILLAALKRRSE